MSNMKQVWLECGGKSPNIIFNSCNKLEEAASMAAQGAFFNQGEVCSANSRLLVERNIQEEFVKRLSSLAKDTQPGNPLNPDSKMGAIVNEEQTNKIMSYIEKGKHKA